MSVKYIKSYLNIASINFACSLLKYFKCSVCTVCTISIIFPRSVILLGKKLLNSRNPCSCYLMT